jgi:hypothetical protein
MTTFIIIAAAFILAIFVTVKFTKKPKAEKSIDVADTLLPESDVHAEIAKMAETIKAQSPVVIEAPFVAKETTKSKKKPAAKKPVPTTKATPKKKGK